MTEATIFTPTNDQINDEFIFGTLICAKSTLLLSKEISYDDYELLEKLTGLCSETMATLPESEWKSKVNCDSVRKFFIFSKLNDKVIVKFDHETFQKYILAMGEIAKGSENLVSILDNLVNGKTDTMAAPVHDEDDHGKSVHIIGSASNDIEAPVETGNVKSSDKVVEDQFELTEFGKKFIQILNDTKDGDEFGDILTDLTLGELCFRHFKRDDTKPRIPSEKAQEILGKFIAFGVKANIKSVFHELGNVRILDLGTETDDEPMIIVTENVTVHDDTTYEVVEPASKVKPLRGDGTPMTNKEIKAMNRRAKQNAARHHAVHH